MKRLPVLMPLFLALSLVPPVAHGDWHAYLDPPASYAAFRRAVEKVAVHHFPDFDVEVYRQANGPDTFQRVMMAVPRGGTARRPAVVAPFYFPEAMLGFDPATGGVSSPLTVPGKDLASYSPIAYMADLARRGYVTISADAYYLTYDPAHAPKNAWAKWGHVGTALGRDQPLAATLAAVDVVLQAQAVLVGLNCFT